MHLAPSVTKENLINDLADTSRRLAIGEGLTIRVWTTKIRHEGIYTLCIKGTSKTTKCVVMKLCPIVVEAWNNFIDLKTRCSLQRRHNSWGRFSLVKSNFLDMIL